MFKVGDRVQSIVDYPDNNDNIVRGSTGTVVHCDDGIAFVEWDDFVNGHDCDGYGNVEWGHGWNVNFDEIELEVDDVQYEFDEEKFKELIGF